MKGFDSEFTKWRLIDDRFTCVSINFRQDGKDKPRSVPSCTLSDYLLLFGFDIIEYVTYCLAENEEYRLKYRVFGGAIFVYITPNK